MRLEKKKSKILPSSQSVVFETLPDSQEAEAVMSGPPHQYFRLLNCFSEVRIDIRDSEVILGDSALNDDNGRMSQFSETLKRLMRDRRVSARVVSQATGIPESTLSEWSGGRAPKLGDDVMKLARFFGCSIDYFLTGKETEAEMIEGVMNGLEDGFSHTSFRYLSSENREAYGRGEEEREIDMRTLKLLLIGILVSGVCFADDFEKLEKKQKSIQAANPFANKKSVCTLVTEKGVELVFNWSFYSTGAYLTTIPAARGGMPKKGTYTVESGILKLEQGEATGMKFNFKYKMVDGGYQYIHEVSPEKKEPL